MIPIALFTRRGAAAALVCAFAAILVGCGGGGGGRSGPPTVGRTYLFTSATQTVALSVDSAGRFTIFARDTAALPGGIGAQGNISSDGTFFTQSDDGAVQFSGTLSGDGTTVTGSVQRGGTALASFSASAVPEGTVSTAALSGTFFGTTGTNAAALTIDVTGHGTLWAQLGAATSGGGVVNVSSSGAITSADGGTVGQFTSTAAGVTLQLTKLNGKAVSATITLRKATRAKWTFMVYLNAANNLDEFSSLNVNEMEKVGSTGDVNMVVQWKQAVCSDCGTPDWTGTRRYFVTKDSDTSHINSQLVEDLGQSVDMGDWHTLRSFVTWAQQRYPADHYALVIWNHGAGWRPTREAIDRRVTPFPRSVSIDDSTNNEIQIWQLPEALDVTPKVDTVIFDASLMQMIEVAYEIRNSTSVIVGSEESPPGEGYVYDTFLSDLVANPAMTAAQLGKQIVTRTLQAYGTNDNLTQSALDTTKVGAIGTALNAFGSSLDAHITDSRAAEIDARNNAENYVYPENKDLWDYADHIIAGTSAADLKTAAKNVQTAITGALIAEQHGTLHPKSHGLAVYVPNPIDYLPSYANLALARDTSWPKWLQDQPASP